MPDAKLELGGEERVTVLLDKVLKKNEELERKLQAVTTASKKSSDEAVTGIEKQIQSLTKMATGWLSVQGAIQGVNAALRYKNELEDRALNRQSGTADAQRKFLVNLGNVSQAEQGRAIASIAEGSRTVGISQKGMYDIASAAVSAKGSMPTAAAIRFGVEAATIMPTDAAEAKSTAVGMLNLASLTGTTDEKINAGTLLALGGQATVSSLADMSNYLVPAAGSVKTLGGGTPQEAMSLVASLGAIMKDPTGQRTGTAAINLTKQLTDFLPTENRYDFDSQGRRKLAAKGTGLTSTSARIDHLLANPQLAERFLATGSFEAAAVAPIRQLLTGGEAADLYRRNVREFGDIRAMGSVRDAWLSSVNQQPIQMVDSGKRRLERVQDAAELADVEGAQGAYGKMAHQRYQDIANRGLSGWFRSVYENMEYYAIPGNAARYTESTIEGRLGGMERSGLGESAEAGLLRELRDEIRMFRSDMKGTAEKKTTVVNPNQHTE